MTQIVDVSTNCVYARVALFAAAAIAQSTGGVKGKVRTRMAPPSPELPSRPAKNGVDVKTDHGK